MFALVLPYLSAADLHISAADYDYWCKGTCDKDVTTSTQNAVILMGGGTDVDDAFKQQITYSGGGDFLVLRTSGTEAYNDYVYGLGKLNSAATLLLKTKKASSDSFVLAKVKAAEAIFFAGGDQSTYVTYWQDTPLNDALIDLATNKKIPFGGTSAGCAIEGDFIYTALNDTVVSKDALADPYNNKVTLGTHMLPFRYLKDFITDTHFKTRDRMGRLITFVARLIQDKWDSNAYGIGVDEKTAIVIDPNGKGVAVGSGTAYVVHASKGPSVCSAGKPLTWEGVTVNKLDANYKDTYNFATLTGGGRTYTLDVRAGAIVQKDPYSG